MWREKGFALAQVSVYCQNLIVFIDIVYIISESNIRFPFFGKVSNCICRKSGTCSKMWSRLKIPPTHTTTKAPSYYAE